MCKTASDRSETLKIVLRTPKLPIDSEVRSNFGDFLRFQKFELLCVRRPPPPVTLEFRVLKFGEKLVFSAPETLNFSVIRAAESFYRVFETI